MLVLIRIGDTHTYTLHVFSSLCCHTYVKWHHPTSCNREIDIFWYMCPEYTASVSSRGDPDVTLTIRKFEAMGRKVVEQNHDVSITACCQNLIIRALAAVKPCFYVYFQ